MLQMLVKMNSKNKYNGQPPVSILGCVQHACGSTAVRHRFETLTPVPAVLLLANDGCSSAWSRLTLLCHLQHTQFYKPCPAAVQHRIKTVPAVLLLANDGSSSAWSRLTLLCRVHHMQF
jgi:hypothetical protein